MNDIAVHVPQQRRIGLLTPTNFVELERFAKIAAASDFVPKDFKDKPGNIMIAVQMGEELGLSPMASLNGIAVINGRPTVWGDVLLGLIIGHPDCIDVIETVDGKGLAAKARCEVQRRGRSPVVGTWDADDDRLAGLTGQGVHGKYPARMYAMRARGFALRDAFPDVLRGIISREEAIDYVVGDPVVEEKPKRRTYAEAVEELRLVFEKCSTPAEVDAAESSADVWWLKDHGGANVHSELAAIVATARDRVSTSGGLLEARKPLRSTEQQMTEGVTEMRDRKAEAPDTERDVNGTPWNENAHASTKAKNADGTWRVRRGVLSAIEAIKAAPAPDPEPKISLGPEFVAWLVDAEGTPLPDENGESAAFTDPVAYARAVRGVLDDAFPPDFAGLEMANREDMDKAAAASPEAAAILAPADGPTTAEPPPNHRPSTAEPPAIHRPSAAEPPAEDDAPDPLQILPPTTQTAREWQRYETTAKLYIGSCTSAPMLAHFQETNEAVYKQFPGKFRTSIMATVQEKQAGFGAPPPKAGKSAREIADGMLSDIAACATLDDQIAYESNASIIRKLASLQSMDATIHGEVVHAAKLRAAALKI